MKTNPTNPFDTPLIRRQKKVPENRDLYSIGKLRCYLPPLEEDFEEEPFLEAPFEDDLEEDPFEELLLAPFEEVLFLAAPLVEVLFLAAPLVEDFEEELLFLEALPFEEAPFLDALFEDDFEEEPPFLEAPFEELFEAPLEELLPAAFFAVAMLFEFNG